MKPKSQAENESDTALLARPARLKAWASDMAAIVEGTEERDRFRHWGGWESRLTRPDLRESLEKIKNCGSVLELRRGLDRQTGEVTPFSLHAGNFCRQPAICPNCAGRLQDTRKRAWRGHIEAAAAEFDHAYLITATIRPRDTWRETFQALRDALTRMRRKGQKGRNGEWGKICAGLGKIELKRGKGGAPHVHWHALVFTRSKLDYRIWDRSKKERVALRPYYDPLAGKEIALSKLTSEWLEATGDSYNFDVRPLEPLQKHLSAGKTPAESIFEQSREVLKYATKFDTGPQAGGERLFAADFVGIRDATYSRRLFGSYGAFFGLGAAEYEDNRHHSTDRPLYFRAGWQIESRQYADPQLVKAPVFPDYETHEGMRRLRVDENRAQGNFRRLRGKLFEARKAARAGRRHKKQRVVVPPVVADWKVYDSEGQVEIKQIPIPPPAYLVKAPKSMRAWERWIGEIKEVGRDTRRRIREEARAAFDDTVDLWAVLVAKDREHKHFDERSAWFQESVIKSFFEVLDAPGRMIPGPAPG